MVKVEGRIGPLLGEHCFVGGGCVGFYVRDSAASELRSTRDVDIAVQISTVAERAQLDQRLRQAGMQEDMEVICRWRLHDVIVDLMPTAGQVFGFTNRWYVDVLATSSRYISGGVSIPYPNVWAYLATKIEAFNGRGGGDFSASHDFEDIVRVIDGDPDVSVPTAGDIKGCQDFVQTSFRTWSQMRKFEEGVAAHLLDLGDQARNTILLERIRNLAGS